MPPKTPGPSPRHPITTVARLTGLTVETLREWERQYQVVRPVRGARGSLYSGNDVKRLQLLAAAVERGRMIEDIASLAAGELEAIIAMPPPPRIEAVKPEAAAAAGGLGVVYMGADLPARLIVDAAARSGVDVVVLGLIYSGATRAVRAEVDYIADHLPGKVELWVGGQLAFDLDGKDAGRRIVRLEDFDALEQHLVGIGATF